MFRVSDKQLIVIFSVIGYLDTDLFGCRSVGHFQLARGNGYAAPCRAGFTIASAREGGRECGCSESFDATLLQVLVCMSNYMIKNMQ
ncbi:MAG: hypothetical protein CSB48_08540 [Proteobacteria bacterium]|nr:MAG: hypothetical protein CSB48_08540 [Pseudomonadota bacterium]